MTDDLIDRADLVKRLRFGSLTTMGAHRMNLEAADRIESDAKRIAELERDVAAVLRREDDANVSAFGHLRRAADAEARVKVLEDALRPFSEAYYRIVYYDGERYDGRLYALRSGDEPLHELLNGLDGEPLSVAHLRVARAALEGEKT